PLLLSASPAPLVPLPRLPTFGVPPPGRRDHLDELSSHLRRHYSVSLSSCGLRREPPAWSRLRIASALLIRASSSSASRRSSSRSCPGFGSITRSSRSSRLRWPAVFDSLDVGNVPSSHSRRTARQRRARGAVLSRRDKRDQSTGHMISESTLS